MKIFNEIFFNEKFQSFNEKFYFVILHKLVKFNYQTVFISQVIQ